MDNIKVMMEGNNFFIFLMVLVAIMGFFLLVGNVIKMLREIIKPHNDKNDEMKTEIKEVKNKMNHIEQAMNSHNGEIEDLRQMSRIQCQAIRALLNHAIHDGNTDEMIRTSNALDDYLTDKI